jgi:putative methionine-R-sulfoxide reductase with GAF domain
MRAAVDLLWDALAGTGVSWIGFYEPGDDCMILGPCRDKPACSPLGLEGMCGRSFLAREAFVVRDARELDGGYIACDPRDLSEVVIPLFDDATCWGVLDADSFDVGAFDASDAVALTELMVIAGLSTQPDDPIVIRTI